jgi:hypothetical protein
MFAKWPIIAATVLVILIGSAVCNIDVCESNYDLHPKNVLAVLELQKEKRLAFPAANK